MPSASAATLRDSKAAAPGNVAIVVKDADFDRAKRALTEIREQSQQIDWSKVDVMEAAEAATIAAEPASTSAKWHISAYRFWWIVELLGITTCFVTWLFTRNLTHLLVYSATAFALLGLFLALLPFAARRY